MNAALKEFFEEESYPYYVPKSALKGLLITDLPAKPFVLCAKIEDNVVYHEGMFTVSLKKKRVNQINITVSSEGNKKYWYGFYGMDAFHEAMKEVAEKDPMMKIEHYSDDEPSFMECVFSFSLVGGELNAILQETEKKMNQLEVAVYENLLEKAKQHLERAKSKLAEL